MKRILIAALLVGPTLALADQGFYVSVVNAGGAAPITAAGSAVTLSRYDLGAGGFNNVFNSGAIVDGTDYLQGGISLYQRTSMGIGGFSHTDAAGVSASTAASNPRGFAFTDFKTGYKGFSVVRSTLTGNDYSGGTLRSFANGPGGTSVSGSGMAGSSGVVFYGPGGAGEIPTFTRGPGMSAESQFQNTRTLLSIPRAGFLTDPRFSFSTFRGDNPGYSRVYSEYGGGIANLTLDRVGADGFADATGVTTFVAETGRYGATGGVYKVRYDYNSMSFGGVVQAFYPVAGFNGALGALHVAVRPGEYNADGVTQLLVTTYMPGDGANSLISIRDDGNFASPSITLLAQAGANERFRGVTAVPEPATLLVLGLGALALRRRRRG